MQLSRSFYWLFSGSLLLLISLLGYGWVQTYESETKRVIDDINSKVQATAQYIQGYNYGKYDLFKVNIDKDYKQKLSFAAGLTQNQARISMTFEPSTPEVKEGNERHDSIISGMNTVEKKINIQHLDAKAREEFRKSLPKDVNVTFGGNPSTDEQSHNKKKDSVIVTIFPVGEEPIRMAVAKEAAKKESEKNYIPKGLWSMPKFDSMLRDTLSRNGLLIPYKTELVPAHLKPYKWSSEVFIINYYEPDIYRITYSRPNGLLIKRLLPYTATSIFVLLLVSAAFLLYHRSYKMQLQTTQFRENLISNVTHELKTPVASLQLIINSLKEKNTDSGQTKEYQYLDYATSELNRMKLLIEKILSFSKLNEKQFALNKEVLNCTNLINEAINIMQVQAEQKQAKITLEQKSQCEILGDKILLINVIANMIDNGIKYNSTNPEIKICLERNNNQALISISDNGIGIAEKYHKKIFEPFFRVPVEGEYNTAGHGIGLSFVDQAIKLHNGTINVNSNNQGTSFVIQLPALT